MPKVHRPRRGTMQFWPRKRARRIYTKIRTWSNPSLSKVLGFAGYKVGMTHINLIDNSSSINKGSIVSVPATIIECPPLKVVGIRFYKKINYKLTAIKDIYNKKFDKELLRKIKVSKKENKEPTDYDEIRLLVYTQPRLTGIGKKKPELFEMTLSDKKSINLAREFFDKEIRLTDVFQAGQQIDIHSVSKGKGFQGSVKKYGLKIRPAKTEKKRRSAASISPWTPKKLLHTTPFPGQLGFNTRTEYNKLTLKISNNLEEINPKGGFKRYGNVKNDYVLLKGSIPGPSKRLIRLTHAVRPSKRIPSQPPEIKSISLSSVQG